ncbi:PREDICTED: integumentary mucin B.1-like [Nanorana parkeri]|uniref:integumentary mucin B.1-like n=1 Tax=Nanorana parkeri TaxID=125878 RepID=UPI000854A257|nr:PREDICTED: integumentary mucin B.1-like [Nanorana parkeri]
MSNCRHCCIAILVCGLALTPTATTPQKKGCCTPSGEFVNDGGSWEKDCITCTCNGNTGKMKCGSYPCDEKVVCGMNETKVFGDPSKQSRTSCCGYCAPLTCKHNGKEYQINESFRDPMDPCLIYTCLASGLTAETTKCPPQSCLPVICTFYQTNLQTNKKRKNKAIIGFLACMRK